MDWRRSARTTCTGVVTPTTSNAVRPTFDDDAGVEYAAFIDAELSDQLAAKASFEQRGLAVITTSAALVAALFGLVAFLTKRDDFELPHLAAIALYAALVLFVVAALCGLFVNTPVKVQAPVGDDELGLEQLVREKWANPPAIARRRVAITRTMFIATYRTKNERKGRLLVAAIRAEATAVVALALAVALILRDST
jgi:hypothetical protein